MPFAPLCRTIDDDEVPCQAPGSACFLLDLIPHMGITLIDDKGILRWMNKTGQRRCADALEDIVGGNVNDLFPHPDYDWVERAAKVLATGKPHEAILWVNGIWMRDTTIKVNDHLVAACADDVSAVVRAASVAALGESVGMRRALQHRPEPLERDRQLAEQLIKRESFVEAAAELGAMPTDVLDSIMRILAST